MSSNFDRDIKGVPLFGSLNDTKRVRRALTLSSGDTESGVNSATPNRKGYQ